MTLKGDAKFKGKLICGLKEDIKGIWLIFIRAVESLKICTLVCSFCPKHIKIQIKKYRRISLMTLNSNAKFEEKLTLGSKSEFSYKKLNVM